MYIISRIIRFYVVGAAMVSLTKYLNNEFFGIENQLGYYAVMMVIGVIFWWAVDYEKPKW